MKSHDYLEKITFFVYTLLRNKKLLNKNRILKLKKELKKIKGYKILNCRFHLSSLQINLQEYSSHVILEVLNKLHIGQQKLMISTLIIGDFSTFLSSECQFNNHLSYINIFRGYP